MTAPWSFLGLLAMLSTFSVSPLVAQFTGDSEDLANQLQIALEGYNTALDDVSVRSVLGSYFIKRDLVTDSLKAGLQRGGSFAADPFLCAQDVVPGVIAGKVQMGEEVCRVEMGIKQYNPEDPPIILVYILCKEPDGWRIDNVDYAEAEMDGEKFNMFTLQDALRWQFVGFVAIGSNPLWIGRSGERSLPTNC